MSPKCIKALAIERKYNTNCAKEHSFNETDSRVEALIA
jgi:hypothetical protein